MASMTQEATSEEQRDAAGETCTAMRSALQPRKRLTYRVTHGTILYSERN